MAQEALRNAERVLATPAVAGTRVFVSVPGAEESVELPPDARTLESIARSAFVLEGWKEVHRIGGVLVHELQRAQVAVRRLRELETGGTRVLAAVRRARAEEIAAERAYRDVLAAWRQALEPLRREIRDALE